MTAPLEPPTTAPAGSELPAWVLPLAQLLEQRLSTLYGAGRDPLLAELITLLSAALSRGLLDLPLTGPPPPGVTAAPWPGGHRRALEASPLARDPDGPLVLEGDRLGWRRWQRQRQAVLQDLVARVGAQPLVAEPAALAPVASLLAGLDSQQGLAVQTVLRQGLVLLEGGPGTGKTSTVARLLEAWLQRHPGGRVQLAAPTGKAAARLRAASGGRVPCTTLHRLLESRTEGFGRDRHNPLELDLLVVDEVSMLDLELMQALLAALPDRCQLVLVGDPAQLPPIAPGSLLLALLDPALTEVLAPVRFELSTVYRNDGAIASVAAALRRQMGAAPTEAGADRPLGPLTGLQPLLTGLGPGDNLQWLEIPPGPLPVAVLQRLRARRRRLASLAERCWPDREEGWQELLAERDRLLVLAPQRRGRWGIEAIHRVLLPAGGSDSNAWPAGTPVLCCRNLPGLDLANGDLGILVERLVGATPQRRILFGHQTPVWHHPAQLSGALEPALALTVHKAQGSEAAEVILLLEQTDGLDPRLLYTGLTRARQQALLVTATATAAAVGPSAAGA